MLNRLEKLLEARDVKQVELERRLGLAPNRVSKWRSGQGEPTAVQAARIARELCVSLEWLIEGVGEMEAAHGPNEVAALTEDERYLLTIIRDSGLTRAEVVSRLTAATGLTVRQVTGAELDAARADAQEHRARKGPGPSTPRKNHG
jgi:transcriptional regulator with XRE-family HTH domain